MAKVIVFRDYANGLVNVIYALLLTITIIVLFETVTVYFRTKRVEVRALLIAGLTGIVRHILVYNVASVDPTIVIGTVAILAVLIAGIVLIKPESTRITSGLHFSLFLRDRECFMCIRCICSEESETIPRYH